MPLVLDIHSLHLYPADVGCTVKWHWLANHDFTVSVPYHLLKAKWLPVLISLYVLIQGSSSEYLNQSVN